MKISELFTGNDNVTIEPSFVWSAIGFAVGLGLEIYCVVTGKIVFNLTDFGLGNAAMLTAMAGAFKLSK